MTTPVRTLPLTADVAEVARLFVGAHLRSVPVLDGARLAGIVSRRDLLRSLVRPDEDIRTDVLQLVEVYTQELGHWVVEVAEGVATVRRCRESRAGGRGPTADRSVITRSTRGDSHGPRCRWSADRRRHRRIRPTPSGEPAGSSRRPPGLAGHRRVGGRSG